MALPVGFEFPLPGEE